MTDSSLGTRTEHKAVNPYVLELRLMIRNALHLWGQLRRHPTALLGLIVIVIYVVSAIAAPLIAPYDPTEQNLMARNRPPFWAEGGSFDHILGTDQLGRDLLSRIIYGGRVSILVGLLATGFSVLVGALLGSLAGYFRGRLDDIVSRFADLLMAFPFLIFAIGVMSMLGPGFSNLIFALSFKGWVEFFRLVRGEMLVEKTKEYVEAARAVGRSDLAIIFSEIAPNIFHTVLVLATLRVGHMIVLEASLSFLGLGIPPEIPAWGSMVAGGRVQLLVAYWISTFPGLALALLVLSINLLGEGLRDILDPRLKLQ